VSARWYARRRTAITTVVVRHDAITAGYFIGDLRKNGASLGGPNFDGDTGNPRGREVSTNGVVGTTLEIGDYIEVQITKDPSLSPTSLLVAVDIRGIEF
jgi:hypothetical protein